MLCTYNICLGKSEVRERKVRRAENIEGQKKTSTRTAFVWISTHATIGTCCKRKEACRGYDTRKRRYKSNWIKPTEQARQKTLFLGRYSQQRLQREYFELTHNTWISALIEGGQWFGAPAAGDASSRVAPWQLLTTLVCWRWFTGSG